MTVPVLLSSNVTNEVHYRRKNMIPNKFNCAKHRSKTNIMMTKNLECIAHFL